MTEKVSINIPVYNRMDLLSRCIYSIYNYTEYNKYELVLIDDGSTESNISKYMKRTANVYIRHDTNLGIAQSRADGVMASSGKYIVELDSDVVVTPGWLTKLVNGYEENAGWPEDAAQKVKIMSALMAHQVGYFIKAGDINDSEYIEVGVVGTACMLFERGYGIEIGNFEPKLGNLWSDLDFCKRVRKQSEHNKIMIDPRVMVYHHGWIDPSTGEMAEDYTGNTRSLKELNTGDKLQRNIESMKLIKKRWGITHPHLQTMEENGEA